MYKMAKAAWIAALRSGDYKQAQGTLCKLDSQGNAVGFCCLGVLCEIAIADGVEVRTSNAGLDKSYDGNNGHLPESVRIWAGLKETNPYLIPQIAEPVDSNEQKCDTCGVYHGAMNIKQESLTAASANDDARLTFDQIADLVEANL